jgi:NRAMP (natural resistance-associated macrophage protein)-like metal ion transporter
MVGVIRREHVGNGKRPLEARVHGEPGTRMNLLRLLRRLGPGFITGTSDDDPSAIATYSQTGAQFGLTQLWSALFTFPLMAAIQEMCGRIGLVTGLGLAAVMRRHYPRAVLYFIVGIQVVTNTVNIGADLSGMGQSCQLLWHAPYAAWLALTTAVTLPLIIFVPYRTYASYLKFLGLTLLTYIGAAITLKIDWRSVASATFVPTFRLDKAFLLNLVAVLGTTISPYEFFWQAGEEVEELAKPSAGALDLSFLRSDTIFGMFFSNLIMYFIILVTALTLGRHGIQNINTAAQAAQALRPFAGPAAFWLFALGIVGAGLLAIPVMAASSAYAICGALDKKGSLEESPSEEPVFYSIIAGSVALGLLINLLPFPPFKLLFYTAVLNGVISPPLLLMVLLVSNNRRIMGKYTNTPLSNVLGYVLLALMSVALCAMLLFPSG